MKEQLIPQPPVVSEDVWLAQRKALLVKEKALTRQYDSVSAERRRLPMVKVEKSYEFDGPDGKVSFLDLFDGKRQLIVYHFMFAPDWDEGCVGCTGYVNALGDLSLLGKKDTAFMLISRAPLEKLEAYKAKHGWNVPWVSSFGSDFNYDFHVSFDKNIAPIEYNYRNEQVLIEKSPNGKAPSGELPGLSVFFTVDGEIYHTYSTYARGTEPLTDVMLLLDITP